MLFGKLFNQTAVPVLNKVVGFTEKRHQALANNIANQNTPFYRAQDLDTVAFNRQLSQAIDARRRPGERARFEFGESRNVSADVQGFISARPVYDANPGLLKHNRNNVDAAREQARMAQNTMLHSTAIELLRKQFDMLRTAIGERVR